MYRQDYILRLIERFGRALLMLRDRILGRRILVADLRTQLGELAHDAGLDLDLARRLDPDTLLLWLAPTGEIDEPRFWLLAELLYLEGVYAWEEGQAAAARLPFEQALRLYERLPHDWQPAGELPPVIGRIEELRRRTEEVEGRL